MYIKKEKKTDIKCKLVDGCSWAEKRAVLGSNLFADSNLEGEGHLQSTAEVPLRKGTESSVTLCPDAVDTGSNTLSMTPKGI